MKKFIIKISIFLAPIIVLFLIPIIILKVSGERFTNIKMIIENDNNYLIGYGYNGHDYGYIKWLTIKKKERVDVMTLGSSRVLQFRDRMFNKHFYNAGFTVSKINDFILYIKSISKEKYPKYLIIGLDQWMFNKDWDKKIIPIKPTEFYNEPSYMALPKYNIIMQVYKDLWNDKYGFKYLNNDSSVKKIGLNAIVNNLGYRPDGSLFYGKLIYTKMNHREYLFTSTFKKINNGNDHFQYGRMVDPYVMNELNRFLHFCKENDICNRLLSTIS